MRFLIYPGNNSKLVKRMFARRRDWMKVKTEKEAPNFIWKPTSGGLKFEKASARLPLILNHFESHSEISQKDRLYLNFKEFCESDARNIWDHVPITYTIEIGTTNTRV